MLEPAALDVAPVDRAIVGFRRDEHGDWAADLECGHRQHVRHAPPFNIRPWVVTAAGRESKIGQALGCRRCARLEIPEGLVPYRRTPSFDERSIPRGLRREHTTKAGVWGRIQVTEGRLLYCIEGSPTRTRELDPTHPGIIPPQVPHRVEPIGPVRFYVEFLSASRS